MSAFGFARRHGKLSVDGVQLVDQKGEAVQLVGMSSHGLHWFPDCYTKESVSTLVEHGCNVFRAAMYIGEGGWEDLRNTARDPKVLLEKIVQWTEELGIYVIVDWHVLTPGDPNYYLEHNRLAIEFWKQVANKYKDKEHVLYELANEPNQVSWGRVKSYHDAMIRVIREIDTSTILILGTCTWSQDIHIACQDPVPHTSNIMYAFHFYAASHAGLYGRLTEYINKLPIFVSEWGTTDSTGFGDPDLDVSKRFLDLLGGRTDLSKTLVSWTQWSYCDQEPAGNAALFPGSSKNQQWDNFTPPARWTMEYIRTIKHT
mmetsp:Transcript_33103/g.53122  ORF Transcript_33103/g.53122 Transcript_33103/m.53122 type:complete len:315 (-) Transcript_33103:231-1175(-)